MEPIFQVKVAHRSSSALLPVKSFLDLQSQVRTAFAILPVAFVFTVKTATAESTVDSQLKFLQLVRHGSELTVREICAVSQVGRGRPKAKMVKMITGAPTMRLGNRAFLSQQIAKEAEVAEIEPVSEEEKCPICMERLRKPMKAKCNHVCCLLCWEKALERVLECPLCRGRVRLKLLRPV